MSEVWSAEHRVDETLAAGLIPAQFARMPCRSVEAEARASLERTVA